MKFTFKSFKGDKNSSEDDPPNPQAKRKDQIRRAQKTHRERKEAYTKSLEIEVVQMRAKEAKILQETKALYAEISVLKGLLIKNGIQLPEPGLQAYPEIESAGTSPENAFDLSIQFSSKSKKQQRIHIQRDIGHHNLPRRERPAITEDDHGVIGANHPSNFSHRLPPPNEKSPVDGQSLYPNANICIGNLDLTAIGMDFVLSLESPCLPHIVPTEQPAATGHALTVSATLLHQHPAPPERRLSPSQATWPVPATGIETLLQLASDLPLLDGELTPVQAWGILRQHPAFGSLDVGRLKGLEEKLLKGVKCYGFGGVIDQTIFDDAVFETFVVGRVF